MSEPLSSHEIEDVLTSIRRLVSDDLRPTTRGAVSAAASGADKLLLTPALRVVTEATPADPAAEPTTDPAAEPAAPLPLPPLALTPDDYDDTSLEQGLSAPFLIATEPETVDWDAGPANAEDILWSAPGAFDDSFSEGAEDAELPPPAPPLAAQTVASGHWSAEVLPEMPVPDWAQGEADWVESDPMTFVAHPRKAALTSDPLARAWADRAEAEVHAELAPEAPQDDATADAGLFDDNDPVLDEGSLRDIVRDILREELAGPLGERITRNVRKLVRAEVYRALTTRDFE